jgi:hypothetical protein
MTLPAADVTSIRGHPHLSPRLWIAAGAEIAVAVAVATTMLHAEHTMPVPEHGESDMGQMEDMGVSHPTEFHWHPVMFIIAGLTVASLIWWLATGRRVAALLTAAGLIGLATSDTVRGMALQSHLIAMAALEALLVAVPLLLIGGVRRNQPAARPGHAGPWTVCVILAGALDSALLITLHLPAVHGRGAHLDLVPLWLPFLVLLIGLSYWAAILLTAGRAGPAVRRGALIIGQEVAAILGLAALLRPSPYMLHSNPFGLSTSVDQRLGGLLMLIACAAVTLPLAKRLNGAQAPQQLRTELNVH